MRHLVLCSLVGLLTLPGIGLAQDGADPDKGDKPRQQQQAPKRTEPTPEERVTRRVDRRVERMTRSLELTEQQVGKLREILLKAETASFQARAEQTKALEGLLTEQQRNKYKAQSQQRRGRQGRQGRQDRQGRDGENRRKRDRRGGAERMIQRALGVDVQQLTEQLGLSPEQAAQIKGLVDAAVQEGAKTLQAMRQDGGQGQDRQKVDRKKLDALLGEARKALREKVASVLNAEQKTRYDTLVQEAEARRERARQGRGGRDPQGRRERAKPEEIIDRRTSGAVKELALPVEEAAVLEPLIKKVVGAQVSMGQKVRALREQIRTLATAEQADTEAIKAKLAELRSARETGQERLSKLREGLQELLTFEQEAKLVALGVLN